MAAADNSRDRHAALFALGTNIQWIASMHSRLGVSGALSMSGISVKVVCVCRHSTSWRASNPSPSTVMVHRSPGVKRLVHSHNGYDSVHKSMLCAQLSLIVGYLLNLYDPIVAYC
jgi:hypothetical protein